MSAQDGSMAVDPREFRRALGKFATGVTVVTTVDKDNARVGVTASSFNSVSIDPPLVLWSIDKRAYSAPVFTTARNFVINVLASDQIDISNAFARRGEDKFAGIECTEGLGRAPRINGTVAHFECRVWNVYEGGDHHIIVGEVLDYHSDEERNALVFHNGRYAIPDQHPVTKDVAAVPEAKGVLGKRVLYLLRQAYAGCAEAFYPKLAGHGVTAEDWRILTLLVDRGRMHIEDIGAIVLQPPRQLRETVGWLRDRDLVEIGADDVVGLTAAGHETSERLLQMASDFENEALGSFSAREIEPFKAQLQKLALVQARDA